MNPQLVPLNSIFEVRHGNKLDFNKMSKCAPSEQAIAFIGRSGERNGFVGFVERLDTVEPRESGLITVSLGGIALSSFVQPRLFYTAQNVDVLCPRSPMSLDVKLFYCLCIDANRFRYSTFGREANRTLKTIPVPSLRDVPSWVSGAATAAVQEFSGDLVALVGANEQAATINQRVFRFEQEQRQGGSSSTRAVQLLEEQDEEDHHDADVARAALRKINANPNSLITGDDLEKNIDEILS